MGCHAPWQSAGVSLACTIVAKDISASLVEFVINDFNIIEKHCNVPSHLCVFWGNNGKRKKPDMNVPFITKFFLLGIEKKMNKLTKAWISHTNVSTISRVSLVRFDFCTSWKTHWKWFHTCCMKTKKWDIRIRYKKIHGSLVIQIYLWTTSKLQRVMFSVKCIYKRICNLLPV